MTTGYKYRMVLAGMVFFISLLLTTNLSAQMTFHLGGQFAGRENHNKELNLAAKSNKSKEQLDKTRLKKEAADNSNKRSGAHSNLRMGSLKEDKEDRSTQSASIDTVQKLRLAQLKRNFAGSPGKTNNY